MDTIKHVSWAVARGIAVWLMWAALFVASMIAMSAAAVLVTSAYAQTPGVERYQATIVDVVDGDTLRVNASGCQDCRIRLTAIDAPESDQPFGDKSREMLSALTGGVGATITLAAKGVDQYGRILAAVYRDTVNINWAMVRNGGSYVYERYADSDALLKLQQAAKRAAQGVWSLAQSQRIRPWDWRHREGVMDGFDALSDVADEMASEFGAAVRQFFSE